MSHFQCGSSLTRIDGGSGENDDDCKNHHDPDHGYDDNNDSGDNIDNSHDGDEHDEDDGNNDDHDDDRHGDYDIE